VSFPPMQQYPAAESIRDSSRHGRHHGPPQQKCAAGCNERIVHAASRPFPHCSSMRWCSRCRNQHYARLRSAQAEAQRLVHCQQNHGIAHGVSHRVELGASRGHRRRGSPRTALQFAYKRCSPPAERRGTTRYSRGHPRQILTWKQPSHLHLR
jgi:hypothetical protein